MLIFSNPFQQSIRIDETWIRSVRGRLLQSPRLMGWPGCAASPFSGRRRDQVATTVCVWEGAHVAIKQLVLFNVCPAKARQPATKTKKRAAFMYRGMGRQQRGPSAVHALFKQLLAHCVQQPQ